MLKEASQTSAKERIQLLNGRLNRITRTFAKPPEPLPEEAELLSLDIDCFCKMCRQPTSHTQEAPSTPPPKVPALDLSPNKTTEFLKKLKLEEYAEVFSSHKISSSDLQYLTRQDLIDMKIPTGPRARILKALAESASILQLSSISFCSSGRFDSFSEQIEGPVGC